MNFDKSNSLMDKEMQPWMSEDEPIVLHGHDGQIVVGDESHKIQVQRCSIPDASHLDKLHGIEEEKKIASLTPFC
ncbi:MAG: hypothetical protein OXQ84_18140 [bacterium]|nr:hypothetical protein [bacterium]